MDANVADQVLARVTALSTEYRRIMAGLDPLAHLKPKIRDAAKKARLVELAHAILAARTRGVSIRDIATGIRELKDRPISVSPDYLSEVMAEYHGAAWTKAESVVRRTGKSKGRKRTNTRKRVTGSIPVNHPSKTKGENEGQEKVSAAMRPPVPKEVHAAQRNAGRKT